jgi:hypothetical protein
VSTPAESRAEGQSDAIHQPGHEETGKTVITERAIFAFFPYLITRERVGIRGIEFRSNQDIADLPADVQEHLITLSQMFFLEDGVRIEQMTCTYLELPSDKGEQEDALRRLHEARLLVGYLYSHPLPSGGVFLPFENSTHFVFRLGNTACNPGMVVTSLVWQGPHHGKRVKQVDAREIPSTDLTPGYTGTRNQTIQLWVAKGSRIFPELPHITLNYSQDLSINLQMFLSRPFHWALEYLYIAPHDYPQGLRSRVFVSLGWYMKGCRASFVEAEELVHLAIALESLLRLRSGEGVTERFKDAVLTLLGPVPRLDIWLDQFYTARSKAVHEGFPSDLNFYPIDKDSLKSKRTKGEPVIPHRSLLEYGRRIFRLCLSSVLAGSAHVRMSGLDALFIPNKERIEAICKGLNQQLPADKRLQSVFQAVYELRDQAFDLADPDVVAVKSVVGAVKLALQAYKEAHPTITKPVEEAIDKILSPSGQPSSALLTQIEECAGQLRSAYSSTDQSHSGRLTDIILALLEYASNPSFKLHCYYRENQTPPSKSTESS